MGVSLETELERQKVFNYRFVSTVIFCVALIIRLIHNSYVMNNPLYYLPLGGHLPYLVMAEKIAAGNIFPLNAPFSLNSPLYPYFLGAELFLTGINQLFFPRLFSIVLDCITCVMVAILSRRHFGAVAGVFSGVMAACYGPMIFYSAELIAVTYTLFFVTLGVLLLDRDGSGWHYLFSGLVMGIAVGTRPNLLFLAILLIPIPLLLKREKRWIKSTFFTIGVILAISPITITNYMISGKPVLLTTSAGHNFYLGHNPEAGAGYGLPESLDGDIFSNMKRLAEKVEGRYFGDDEISPYYMSKALSHICRHPEREIQIVGKKAIAAINDYEATNYVNYYFQKDLSPILTYSISFGILFPLAVLGIVLGYKRYLLLMPVAATFLTILMFFYIARLRMPMIPFLLVFAGGALSLIVSHVTKRSWNRFVLTCFLVAGVYVLSNWKLAEIDTSNEWNKVGVVFRVQERYADAERAFFRARGENPKNPNTYRNLAFLYNSTACPKKANKMRTIANRLINRDKEKRFTANLEEQ